MKQSAVINSLPAIANGAMAVELKRHPRFMVKRVRWLMNQKDPTTAILLDQAHAIEEALSPGSHPDVAPYWLGIQAKARELGHRAGVGMGKDDDSGGGWLSFLGTVVTQVAGPLAQKGLAKENRQKAQATAGSSEAVRQAQLAQAQAQQAAALAQAQAEYQVALAEAEKKSRKKVYIGLGIGGGVLALLFGGYLLVRKRK